MTRTLRFYGHSDDLMEINGTLIDEPSLVSVYETPGTVRVANDEAGLFVTALYQPNLACACWMIGIAPLDDNVPLPDWPMRWSAQRYTTVLEIDVPDDVRISEAGNTLED